MASHRFQLLIKLGGVGIVELVEGGLVKVLLGFYHRRKVPVRVLGTKHHVGNL